MRNSRINPLLSFFLVIGLSAAILWVAFMRIGKAYKEGFEEGSRISALYYKCHKSFPGERFRDYLIKNKANPQTCEELDSLESKSAAE